MLNVLIVDDEPLIAQGLCILIDWNAEGCEAPAVAANGEEALAYLKCHPADLVLTDIRMPVMDGLELLKANNREGISDAAFVILSGYSEFSYAQTALRYGCIDYLLKPIEREALLKIVRKVRELRRKQTPGGAERSAAAGTTAATDAAEAMEAGAIPKNVSDAVLQKIERDIETGYAQNLTLKMLGNKYFLNSSYLGQMFRKKYGVSFKDYLNQVRIDAAASLLLTSDKKVAVIAEETGYHDTDYFIRKFIELKGCTPTTFRKNR